MECRDTVYDLCVVAGETFRLVIVHKSEDAEGNQTITDLTGYTASMQIRKRVTDTVVAMDVTAIVSDPVNGEITCTLDGTQTASLIGDNQVKSIHFYDLKIESADSSHIETLLTGKYKTIRGVTR